MVRKLKNKLLLLLLAGCVFSANAENTFRWQSRLSATGGEGFYRVLLSPEITGLSESAYRDLRVLDSAGHYVPYIIKTEEAIKQSSTFQPLDFTTKADSVFTLQIENPTARLCSELWITLRNKALSTETFLSGSDNGQKWFDISGDVVLYPGWKTGADSFEQRISFPAVKYRHLRFTMRITRNIPVNIVNIGLYESQSRGGRYSVIPAPKLNAKDSAKTTYVSLNYNAAYQIDRLIFNVEGAHLYHRHINIYSADSNNKTYLGQYMLSSASDNVIDLSVKTSALKIEIDNQDNPPLEVKAIEARQLNSYAQMYLNGDRNYFLVFGNAKAEKPSYDLEYFQDSLKAHTPTDLDAGPIKPNSIVPNAEPARTEIKGVKKYWIWPVLLSVLALLLFFTLRMGKEMGGKAD